MIEALVGNSIVEKILLYITNYGDGYISGIAEPLGFPNLKLVNSFFVWKMVVFWLLVIKVASEYILLILYVFIKLN
jgi:hypothetical protein